MGGKLMSTELYDKIVTDRLVFGKPAKQIADEIERKDSAVYTTVSAFNAVKDQDWNRCIALVSNQNLPIDLFNWAGERLGVEIPQAVADAHKQRLSRAAQMNRERRSEKKSVEPPSEPSPTENDEQPKPEKPDNTSLYLLRLLEAINQQNELLAQLMDAVIPKYVADMKDNVNANCDTLFNQLKDNGDRLEAIKINTRKRGL